VQTLRGIVGERAAHHKGRIFNTAGDGLMLEFPTVADGVAGALDIAEAAAEASKSGLPLIRLGLHVGDVTVLANGDLIGAGVNVAARVQQRAVPGEILTTGDVRNLFATQSAAQFTRYGGAQLDKMARQVDLFALARPGFKAQRSWVQRMRQNNWRLAQAGVAALVALAITAALVFSFQQGKRTQQPVVGGGQPVVAMVPFENLSGDATLNYFSAGMTEEIQHAVSRIRGIRVVTRTAGGDERELRGATHLLTGSVKKNADRVRVSAQLARSSGEILWSDSFERPIAETVVVQDEIARKVAQALSVVAPESAKTASIDPKAFELYLRGRDLWRTGGEGSMTPRGAIADLEEAVKIAPEFARAWVALASAYAQRQNWSAGDEQVALIDKARAAATKALELDPQLGEAYLVLARFNPSNDWAERGAQFAKAVAAEPNDADVLMLHAGFWLSDIGQMNEAVRELAEAYEIDPSSGLVMNKYCEALVAIGDIGTVEKIIAEREALDPTAGTLWQIVMVDRLRKGDFTAARLYRDKLYATYDKLAADYPNAKLGEAKTHIDAIIVALETKDPAKIAVIVDGLKDQLSQGQAAAAQSTFDYVLMGRMDLAKDVLAKLYLEDGYKDVTTSEPVYMVPTAYPDGRVPTNFLMNEYFKPLWKDPVLWKIFATRGLAKYWLDSGVWPDFCASIGGVAACKAEAEKSLAALRVN
jgi:TolB-like protein/Tfp pilus assembly protein PilF